ncbi:pyruvate, water dikinase regulatory protein [Nocardioides sp.]|uniref:pyruvate, water dikinase regulatory protein n=1 Tax=Nocardioides sp. TaxID=35761 RepID=UPI003514B2DC
MTGVSGGPEGPDVGTGAGGAPATDRVVPVYFLSDSTGISAETMGNALLLQFPDTVFERRTIPFITTIEAAQQVVAELDAVMEGPVTPLAFTTAAEDRIRNELARTRAPLIDFFEMHMARVESILGQRGVREVARLHGVGDIKAYNTRMAAVEFTIEHDDGQSLRALERADVILLAPSRCGKTPTSMYLALQHGLFVANYPLVEEDLESHQLPRPVRDYAARCFGITTTAERLARVRAERRPDSRYAELSQCRWELRRAESLYSGHRIPVIDSSTKSVEEMAAMILQTLARSRTRPSAASERSR